MRTLLRCRARCCRLWHLRGHATWLLSKSMPPGGMASAVRWFCPISAGLNASVKFHLPVMAFAHARVPRGRRRLSSWRKGDVAVLCGAEVLRCAAAAEAQPEHPAHIAGAWLGALLWLEDGRWRKLRSGGAPTEALEALLDVLSRRTLLLSLPAAPDEDAQAGTPSSTAAAAQDELAPIWPVESNPTTKEVRNLLMRAGGNAVQDILCYFNSFKVIWTMQHGLAAASSAML